MGKPVAGGAACGREGSPAREEGAGRGRPGARVPRQASASPVSSPLCVTGA